MGSIVPFENAKLPAFIKAGDVAELNNDLTAHAGVGFPIISIKGKVFAVVRGNDREVLMNPKDPESTASSIEMVVVKANKGTSKVYYPGGFKEGAENVKPDCFSNMGDKPDPQAAKPQAKSCAACKWNVWGSKIGDNGNKGKACGDSVRIAVATPDRLDEPYLIRVPAASIRPLGEYGDLLKKRGVGYNMVVTKIGFEAEVATPQLTFKPVGFVDADMYAKIKEQADSDVVKRIIGSTPLDEFAQEPVVVEAAPAPATTKEILASTVKPDKVVTEQDVAVVLAKAVAKPAPKVTPVEEVDVTIEGLDLENLSFD